MTRSATLGEPGANTAPAPTQAARPAEWRGGCPVLVAEAQTLGAIGVIRSLGRAGYPVHACSSQPDAIGLGSRAASASVVCPSYDRPEFLHWLRGYVAAHGIRAIVPSEGMLLALRPAFEELSPLLPFCRDEKTLYAGMSKCDVFAALTHSADQPAHLPPSLLVEAGGPLPPVESLHRLGAPLYLKVDACHGCAVAEAEARPSVGGVFGAHTRLGPRPERHSPGQVHKAPTAETAMELLAELLGRYEKVLIQGHVPGRGVGAFFLIWQGQVLAEFMHRRLHEVPCEGGVSSFRESCFIPAIRDDALAKLRRLGWEGIAMMEYRHDERTGRFDFLELNGRFWGSLHLALFAGVDFPTLLLDAFFGHPSVAGAPPVRRTVRCRHTFPAEVQYVWSRLKSPNLSFRARAWSVVEFFLLSLDPRIHSDLLFPGDRMLYAKNFRRFCGDTWRAVKRRLRKAQPG